MPATSLMTASRLLARRPSRAVRVPRARRSASASGSSPGPGGNRPGRLKFDSSSGQPRGYFRQEDGWDAGIRTPILRFRAACPTVERRPKRRERLARRGASGQAGGRSGGLGAHRSRENQGQAHISSCPCSPCLTAERRCARTGGGRASPERPPPVLECRSARPPTQRLRRAPGNCLGTLQPTFRGTRVAKPPVGPNRCTR